jgi:hypothetical protein
MPPIVRILPRVLLVYVKLFGFLASNGSPQEGHFMIDRWQRWQKNDEGRDGLDPWFPV